MTTRHIIITVDTEEEGLWGGGYSVTGNTTDNLRGLPRFQSACEELSTPPTYLIDAPVTEDLVAVDLMRTWQRQGRCEVGAHCHPWCNPPLPSRVQRPEETYLSNLPIDLQLEKLRWLTSRISEMMEQAPTSYRSGRYGFDHDTATILDDLGYLVDSSVLPLFDYRENGGPDYTLVSRKPYRFFAEETGRKLVEVPITSGFTRPGYEFQRKLWAGLRKQPWKRLRLPGIADRLGLARRVKLSPEQYTQEDLRGLIDSAVTDGLSTLVLMLHSSSLVPGMSPYAKTDSDLEAFYRTMTFAIRYAVTEHQFTPVTLTQSVEQVFVSGCTQVASDLI